MHFYKSKPLVFFLSALLGLAACSKSSDSDPVTLPTPVTEPLKIAAAKPGDTLIIKGQNFNEIAANNTVKISGITATVVSATTTELKVVIPANATSGAVTVNVNGITVDVGSLVLNPLTLYCVKMDTVTNAPEWLVGINPADGKESPIASMGEIPEYAIPNIVYLSATNEVIYLNDSATGLIKINVATKQTSTVRLAGAGNLVRFNELVTDKSGNLYAIKNDASIQNNYYQNFVRIDPKDGGLTSLKTIVRKNGLHVEASTYVPATNEIVGKSDFGGLFKINLRTNDTSTIQLTNGNFETVYGMGPDKQGNLIGYKMITDPNTYNSTEQVVQINTVTGAQTVLVPITGDIYLPQNTICALPTRNELVGLYEKNKLYRINLGTKTADVVTLTTQTNMWYYKMTNN
ncbi:MULTISPECIES: IPT/TIG domain-containing protein [Niastella]|uniref:IPT/TIG domain-containing protein n=1 Tax=Niastella soli TaxID=2821487 RepID=A0ABS3YYK9_9BACT|nr:IPT/TIG domain-containing protein [Niastella soli]MBO9203015.1 IPT/TIG domain-containing protein [Niastella soli]